MRAAEANGSCSPLQVVSSWHRAHTRSLGQRGAVLHRPFSWQLSRLSSYSSAHSSIAAQTLQLATQQQHARAAQINAKAAAAHALPVSFWPPGRCAAGMCHVATTPSFEGLPTSAPTSLALLLLAARARHEKAHEKLAGCRQSLQRLLANQAKPTSNLLASLWCWLREPPLRNETTVELMAGALTASLTAT